MSSTSFWCFWPKREGFRPRGIPGKSAIDTYIHVPQVDSGLEIPSGPRTCVHITLSGVLFGFMRFYIFLCPSSPAVGILMSYITVVFVLVQSFGRSSLRIAHKFSYVTRLPSVPSSKVVALPNPTSRALLFIAIIPWKNTSANCYIQ